MIDETNGSAVVVPVDHAVAQLERRLEAQERRIGALYMEREQQRNAQISAANTLIEILGQLRHIKTAIETTDPSTSRSSVVVKTGTNGTPVAVECKAYQGSDIHEPEREALECFVRLRAEIEARLMDGFRQTVKASGK